MATTKSDPVGDVLKRINASGFPFQLRVEEEIKRTHRSHHWYVLSREHAWSNPQTGGRGFIDLVIGKPGYKDCRLVIECKRMKADDARQLQWLFLIPDKELINTQTSTCLEVRGINKGPGMENDRYLQVWDTMRLSPKSFQSEFCVLVGDDQKSSSLLERLASDVLDSAEGLAHEEINIAQVEHSRDALFKFIIPVIVTNAELTVCRFDPSQIDLAKGTLDRESLETKTVPFIRFRKSLATDFQLIPQSEEANGRFTHKVIDIESANQARERTVFIVNASHLPEFLANWEIERGELPGGEFACQLYPHLSIKHKIVTSSRP